MFLFCMEQELELLQNTDPKKKSNMELPEMSPPRKDPNPNQDSTRIITQKYPILTQLL